MGTDQRTNQPTDIVSYRGASSHLINKSSEDKCNPEPLAPKRDDLSMDELEASLKAGMVKGAEGPGGLAFCFLRNLEESSKDFLLDTFNKS
jgi:hypothetical protein